MKYLSFRLDIIYEEEIFFFFFSALKLSLLPVAVHSAELVEISVVSGTLVINFSALFVDLLNG